jgi:hypothetical protein
MSKAKSKARAIARARRLAKPVAVPKVDVPVAPAQVAILAEEEKPTPFTFWAVPIDMMNMWLGVIAPNRQQRKGGDALGLHHPLVVASSKETPAQTGCRPFRLRYAFKVAIFGSTRSQNSVESVESCSFTVAM